MNVTLLHGDCLEVMAMLAPQSIDAILTDLPYGSTGGAWDEIIPLEPMWKQVKRILKSRSVFVTTTAQPFTTRLIASNLAYFRHDLVWDKVSASSPGNSLIAPKRTHESILVFGDPGHVYNPIMWDAGKPHTKRGQGPRHLGVERKRQYEQDFSYKTDENLRYPVSVIRLARGANECNSTQRLHPTQKPVALYEYLIRTYTNPGDHILDMCMGSGTTGVATVKEGRNFVGVELDRGYFDIAEKRIAEAQMQMPLLEVQA